MKTSGHLASNGGIRGHSAGECFPFIVVGTGDDMWHVRSPDGRCSPSYKRAGQACAVALAAKQGKVLTLLWDKAHG